MTLGLSLPATCTALLVYEDLEELLLALNKEWLDQNNLEPLVRTRIYIFAGRTLKDVVQDQANLDMEITPLGSQAEGAIVWFSTVFLVITTRNWADHGLFCVFMYDVNVDEEGNKAELESRAMDRFFLSLDDAPKLLSSFSFGDLAFVDAKDQYGIL